jgi:hypothetical protein
VTATEDRAFDQAMLLRASHALFITQARVVADTIEQAAQRAARVGASK